jgi:hypothetical protein
VRRELHRIEGRDFVSCGLCETELSSIDAIPALDVDAELVASTPLPFGRARARPISFHEGIR